MNMDNASGPASRALLVGAMLGGAASIATQWKKHQTGEIKTEQLVSTAAKDAVKAAVIGGATTYVAEKMSGQPILSLATILAAGTAGLYLLEQHRENNSNE